VRITDVDDVLSGLPLFAALDDDANAALREAMRHEQFQRGQIIFNEGDQGDKLYAVIEGKVKLARTAPDGRENLQAVLGPGEMFGELSLFDPKPRTAGAIAVTDSVLASLAHDALRPWITGRPAVAVQLLKALAQRLRRTNDVLADLVFSDVPARVAKALLGLAERFGQPTPEGLHVAHDLTQEELAQLVGASRETVNKALADFSARGWLRIESRAVVIKDVDGLTRRVK
jgi:CRP/FNR family transcriptional regulator, cyclic AMP receptor protein